MPQIDRKQLVLSAILSFVINAGIWIFSSWVPGASCFALEVAVPIATLFLVFRCAVVGPHPVAMGLLIGLICGLPVGLIAAIIYGLEHMQLEVVGMIYLRI